MITQESKWELAWENKTLFLVPTLVCTRKQGGKTSSGTAKRCMLSDASLESDKN